MEYRPIADAEVFREPLRIIGNCPSSDDLRQFGCFRKGGSGSSVVEIKRHAGDAANDDCDGLAFDPFAFEEDGLGPPEVNVSRMRLPRLS